MNKLRTLFAAAALVASASVFAADVSGAWLMSQESPQGKRESTLTLTQKGSELTGAIKGARGENPITGTVTGDEIKFSYKVSFGGNDMVMEYTGKVSGNTITGTNKTPRGETPFTATKQ